MIRLLPSLRVDGLLASVVHRKSSPEHDLPGVWAFAPFKTVSNRIAGSAG